MASSVRDRRWNVRTGAPQEYTRIEDAQGNLVAMVTSPNAKDAHLMAASPELYDRLLEVQQLRRAADGEGPKPLLPPEAMRTINETLRAARGES